MPTRYPLLLSLSLSLLGACGNATPPPAAGTDGPAAPIPSAPGGGSYDPCAGKAKGDACTACPPGDATCVETAEIKACDANGQCRSSPG